MIDGIHQSVEPALESLGIEPCLHIDITCGSLRSVSAVACSGAFSNVDFDIDAEDDGDGIR